MLKMALETELQETLPLVAYMVPIGRFYLVSQAVSFRCEC